MKKPYARTLLAAGLALGIACGATVLGTAPAQAAGKAKVDHITVSISGASAYIFPGSKWGMIWADVKDTKWDGHGVYLEVKTSAGKVKYTNYKGSNMSVRAALPLNTQSIRLCVDDWGKDTCGAWKPFTVYSIWNK